jgi:phosphodiesterase/alkaline phosphatase D-like protein
MTRRQWIGAVGAGAAVLACGDNAAAAVPMVAVLEPSPTGFVVTVSAHGAFGAAIEVRHELVLVTSELVDLTATESGQLVVSNLQPDTLYTVSVRVDAGLPATHTIRTAPADDDQRPVRLAVSADYDSSDEFDNPLYDHMIREAPELHVTIGDFPYTDKGPIAETVEQYRERHADLRAAPRVRAMFQAMGVRSIYDDHEFRNNWDAGFVAQEPDRYAAAMQVWDEYFPIPGAPPEIRYRTFRWGAHVEGFLLDCRRFRSADDAPDDGKKTMLGATQLAWFLGAIAASTATWKLVFTSIPLDFGNGNDHWATFTTERALIFNAIVGIPGVLFLSGDQHWFAAHRHQYGIREIQIGPAARGFGKPEGQPAGVLFRKVLYNFGLLVATAKTLTMSGVGPDGEHFYKESWTPQDLTPRTPTHSRD